MKSTLRRAEKNDKKKIERRVGTVYELVRFVKGCNAFECIFFKRETTKHGKREKSLAGKTVTVHGQRQLLMESEAIGPVIPSEVEGSVRSPISMRSLDKLGMTKEPVLLSCTDMGRQSVKSYEKFRVFRS